MPRLLAAIVAVLSATATGALDDDSNWPLRDLYVVAGQSNAVGMGLTAELPADLARPPRHALQFRTSNGQSEWKPFLVGAPGWRKYFGPEVAFCHQLSKRVYGAGPNQIQERFGIVKVGKGWTGMYNWTAADTSGEIPLAGISARLEAAHESRGIVESDDELVGAAAGGRTTAPGAWTVQASGVPSIETKGGMWRSLVRTVKEAMHDKACHESRCRIRGFLWVQGERDARSKEEGDRYLDELTDLFEKFREVTKSPKMFILIGQINPADARPYPGLPAVRAAQFKAAEKVPRATLVATDGLSKHGDRLHWDTAGQAALGVRMANQLLLLMEKHADKDKANTKRPP